MRNNEVLYNVFYINTRGEQVSDTTSKRIMEYMKRLNEDSNNKFYKDLVIVECRQ